MWWIATSDESEDEPIAEEAQARRASVARGPLDDVLRRFVMATSNDDEAIVRLTADCPLLDPKVVAMTVAAFGAATSICEHVDLDRCLGGSTSRSSASALLEAEGPHPDIAHVHVTPSVREWPLLCRWIRLRSRRFELQSHGRHGRRSLSRGSDVNAQVQHPSFRGETRLLSSIVTLRSLAQFQLRQKELDEG